MALTALLSIFGFSKTMGGVCGHLRHTRKDKVWVLMLFLSLTPFIGLSMIIYKIFDWYNPTQKEMLNG